VRPGSDALKDVLTGSFSTRLIADVFYGVERTMKDVPVVDWSLSWNVGAEIKATGSVTVQFTDELARSMTPKRFTDTFSAFGQEMNLLLEVSAGRFTETVQLGRYRVTAVPSSRDAYFGFSGRTLVSGSTIELTLEDRLVGVKRWGFPSEQNPVLTGSCWGELGRLTGMQVKRSGLPDKGVPGSVVYAASEGARLKAVQELANALGGVPYCTPDGALSVLPDKPGAPVVELVLGEGGTILDVEYSLESDGVYNEVVGTYEDADRNPIVYVAQILEGPLRVGGPYGTYTRYYSSQLVKTGAQAGPATEAVLRQVSASRTYRVPVVCVVNPLIEFGDVVTVEVPGSAVPLSGRVQSYGLSSAGSMSLELEVSRDEG
jgi:hypothetical protein